MTSFTLGTPSEAFRRRWSPLPWGFVAVRNPLQRHALVHIVHADTFGAVAKHVLRGEEVKTLCGRAMMTPTWELVPRLPDNGHLLSCNNCRGALSHYGLIAPTPSSPD